VLTIAAAPLLVVALAMAIDWRLTAGRLRVDPPQLPAPPWARALANRAAVELTIEVVAAAALVVAAGVLLGAALSLDAPKLGRGPRWPWLAALATAAAVAGGRVVLHDRWASTALLAASAIVFGVLVVVSPLAARSAAIARGWPDPAEARTLLASVVLGTAALAGAVLLLDAADGAIADLRVLGDIVADVPPLEHWEMLRWRHHVIPAHVWTAAIDGAAAFVVAVAAIVPGLRRDRHPLRGSALGALGATVLLVSSPAGTRPSLVELADLMDTEPRYPAPPPSPDLARLQDGAR
jgi:hypothetical protein